MFQFICFADAGILNSTQRFNMMLFDYNINLSISHICCHFCLLLNDQTTRKKDHCKAFSCMASTV